MKNKFLIEKGIHCFLLKSSFNYFKVNSMENSKNELQLWNFNLIFINLIELN